MDCLLYYFHQFNLFRNSAFHFNGRLQIGLHNFQQQFLNLQGSSYQKFMLKIL